MSVLVSLRVTVDKDPDNEATGWVPPPSVVAETLAELVVDLDLDTGWVVKSVTT